MAVTVSAGRGFVAAAADGAPLLAGASVRLNGAPLPSGELSVSPVDVTRRSAVPAVCERWLTALELPIAIWEIETDADGELAVELAPAGGRELVIGVDGGVVERAAPHSSGGVSIRRADRTRALRVSIGASRDEDDLARTLDLAGRRGFAGLVAQRAQHARVISEYGATVVTPDPAVNRAFEWAKLRADERARSMGDPEAARALLAAGLREAARDQRRSGPNALEDAWQRWVGEPGPAIAGDRPASGWSVGTIPGDPERAAIAAPASFLDGAIRGLWGAVPDASRGLLALAPTLPPSWDRLELLRLRVGTTVLDASLRRRPGRLVARVRRRQGAPLTLSFTLPGAGVSTLELDGVMLEGRTARFELAGEHEISAIAEG